MRTQDGSLESVSLYGGCPDMRATVTGSSMKPEQHPLFFEQ
jgi:hypothetical protein